MHHPHDPILRVALLGIHGDVIDALARSQGGLVGAMVEVIRNYLYPRMMRCTRLEELQRDLDALEESYRSYERSGSDQSRIARLREEHLAIAEGLSERVELLRATISRSRALGPLLMSLKDAGATDPVDVGDELSALLRDDDERNVLTLLYRYLDSLPDLHLVIEPARIHG